jgi:hypothetical protein
MSSQAAPNQLNEGDIKLLEVLPTQNRTRNMFNCFYPGVEPTIKKIQESVPLPANIMEALNYAVRYIEQGATTTRTIEQQYETLEKRYQAATERIHGDHEELGKLQGQMESQSSRITELEDNLAVKERLALRLTRQIINLRNEEQSGGDADTPELMEVREKLELTTSRERDAKDKYEAAQKENTDLKSKLALEINNSASLQEDKESLEASMATKEQELLILRKKFAQVSVEFEEAKHHIDVDGHIISGIQDEREILVKENRQKTEEIEVIKTDWAAARKAWKAELDETLVKLEKVEDEKQVLEEELQRCEQRLKAAEEALKSLEEEHQLCAPRLRAIEEAKKTLEEEHQRCGPKLKIAEEAKKFLEEREASLEAQLKEAKKPKLDNDVTLDDPITIAGSLSGADSDIDDKFWKIPTLPFAVSIYGHSSKNLFVTDNGMICFDQDIRKPADHLQAKELPYNGAPPYTLFPFWTDLMLVKGKPHGIFYQITGQPGVRTLTVEWYVTHFRNKDLYYQFTASLEEAKPDFATFRYYKVQDKGENSTVGVQGSSQAMTFSFKQPKILPGLQVVFDTKNDRKVHSTFEIKKK